MADLGDIPIRLQGTHRSLWTFPSGEKAPGSVWQRPSLPTAEAHGVTGMQYSHGAGQKTLSGTVAGDQTDFTQVVVRAYRKSTGKLASEVRPEANGAFSMPVDGDPQQFFVVAFDPVGGEEFNALIFDRITTS